MRNFVFCLLLTGCIGHANGAARDSVPQRLQFGQMDIAAQSPSPGETAYLLSGEKMYEVACIDGTYPRGNEPWNEQGIWCHPVKLASAIGCSIIENDREWELTHADEFTYRFHSAECTFKGNGLHVARENTVAEKQPVLLTTLAITNRLAQERTLTLRFTLHIDLRPSWRCAELKRSPVRIAHEGNTLTARCASGSLVAGNAEKPQDVRVNDSIAVLEYRATVSPKGTTRFSFLLAGENQGNLHAAQEAFRQWAAHPEALRKGKQARYTQAVFDEGTTFDCSDRRLTDAFYCAKANVLLNTCHHAPYVEHPFIRAGVPTYPRLFGTDFCFSLCGLLSSGFSSTARSTLLNMAAYAQMHLRGPHEVSSDGKLLGWDHIQVTPQLVAACADYYAWTGDAAFLKETYPLCRVLIDDVLANADNDKDGFIEGHGLMEESEFKGNWEELSASAYLYAAFNALAFMAHENGDKQSATAYKRKAAAYRTSFNRQWWNEDESMWYCAFSENGEGKAYDFWSVVFPQRTGVALPDKAQMAMNRIERDWVNDTWGMVGRFQPERNQDNDGVGIVHNNLCATAAFACGKDKLGWKLLQLAAQCAFDLPHSCLGLFPECQPGLCSNISQLWSYSTFMESVLCGLAGISTDPADGSIRIAPAFPPGLSHLSVENMEIQGERLSLRWSRAENGKINVKATFSGDLKQIKRPKFAKNVSFELCP